MEDQERFEDTGRASSNLNEETNPHFVFVIYTSMALETERRIGEFLKG